MKKSNFLNLIMILIYIKTWPLNENIKTINKNNNLLQKYVNIIEVRDFFFNDCDIKNPIYKFIIFINQTSNEYSININHIFKLESINNSKNNIKINCEGKTENDRLYCNFNKQILIESGYKYKIKDIIKEISFNCSKKNSNIIEKCVLLPFKTNFQIDYIKYFDIIPEQNNKTYLVDFRKNEILNFNIKTDNYILNEQPEILINDTKIKCNQIENKERKGFGKNLECVVNRNNINYNFTNRFNVIMNKCGIKTPTHIYVVILNHSNFNKPLIDIIILFIFFIFI